jgi:gluconolactonase
MSWSFERVAGPFNFTEGSVWTGEALLFSDFPSSRTYRYDPLTGETTLYLEGTEEGNGQTLDREGRLLQVRHKGRRVVRYEADGSVTVLADQFGDLRLNSPNDVVVDRLGRIWFTDPRYGDVRDDMELEHESVYRLDPQADDTFLLTRVTYDTTCPNGLIVTPEMDTLIVAQSKYGDGELRELRAYPILNDGSLGAYEVLHNFYPHRGIDGMRLDDHGNIVACAGWEQSGPGPMIYLMTPNGRVLETHPTPANPTNCCFGDADLGTLYVTAADGCLYRARTDRRGVSTT